MVTEDEAFELTANADAEHIAKIKKLVTEELLRRAEEASANRRMAESLYNKTQNDEVTAWKQYLHAGRKQK